MVRVDTSDDASTGGGNFLKTPGTFHVTITDVVEEPTKKNGEMLSAWKIVCVVLAGTVSDQEKKTVDLMLWHPKLDGKDKGEFAKKKQTRLLLASGLMTEDQLGKSIDVDLQSAVHRSLIVEIEESDRDDKKYYDVAFANIFHIDDPAVAKIPRDANAIKILPSSQRRRADSFKAAATEEKPKSKTDESDLDDI